MQNRESVISSPTSKEFFFLGMGHIPFKIRVRVSLLDATHWSSASALQTRFDAAAVSWEGFKRG